MDDSIAALVTDIEMPGLMDGLTLAQTAAARWPSIAIVIVSGRRLPSPDELPNHAYFLTKPYTACCLAEVVGKLLRPSGY
jgi:FixJ family two-component response regulator